MKKSAFCIALSSVLLSVGLAQAGEFSGGWVGGKLGSGRSGFTGLESKSATTYGLEGGYNWDLNNFLLGVDGFADANEKATHNPGAINYGSNAYGLDAKLGLPNGKWLPYAKLGYAHTKGSGNALASAVGGNDVHLGLGVEYKFAPQWSVAGEYTTASAKTGANKLNNNNFTIGLNYYFSGPKAAPVAAAPVPVVVKQEPKPEPVVAPAPAPAPAPVPAPAPAPKESWKTVVSDKPITIEGTSFDTNSAKLKPAADKKLNEVVDFAAKYKDANLQVTGYTDSRGSDKLNMALSAKRAESVKAFLVKKGVAASRISTKGEGAANPVGDNKTEAGRAQNRRVEIRSVIREENKVRVVE
ncbi:MAG: OmpA family protein [Nitrosomonadales bacterium]|nr:OmpA family protein [Nitrosomonadales bacterium]